MGFLLDLVVALIPAPKWGARAPRRHPVPVGFWRDVLNTMILAGAAALAVVSGVFAWGMWRLANDDMLGIVFVMLLPVAAMALMTSISLVIAAVGFVRRP